MNEIKAICPLMGIATACAGGSPFAPCMGDRCAWFDPATLHCAVHTKE